MVPSASARAPRMSPATNAEGDVNVARCVIVPEPAVFVYTTTVFAGVLSSATSIHCALVLVGVLLPLHFNMSP